jgi:twitching motility protein PilT
MTVDELLRKMVEIGASDLHIKVGNRPGFRVDGKINTLEAMAVLRPEDTHALVYSVLDAVQQAEFEKTGDLDFGHSVPGLSRFRVNVLKQRGSVGMVMRQIPISIPNIDDLGLPAVCKILCLKPRGMVLVTGPTGSGKSTTLAAMVDYVNENKYDHIITMEDPIEFIHKDKKSFINQREVGRDTVSFSEALRRALRQDPDVILVGELRDLETISLAITAAETGHLVFATLHTTSAVKTIDRMIDVFPGSQQSQIRLQLSVALQGVVSQILLPKIGGGRVAAHEIMIATDGVRGAIREGKTPQIQNFLQTSFKEGMITLESSLANLVKARKITFEDAIAKANSPNTFEMLIKGGPGGRT